MSGYRKIVINAPDPLTDLWSKALHLIGWKLRMEGNTPSSEKAMLLECLEYMLASVIIELEPEHAVFLRELKDELTTNRWLSLERDSFRCQICGASGVNRGGSQAHHIIPRSWRGWRPVPLHDIKNLATLCRTCHEGVTHPQAQGDHWRQVAVRLWQKLGESDLVALWQSRGK